MTTSAPKNVLDRLAAHVNTAMTAATITEGLIRSGSTFRSSDLPLAEQHAREVVEAIRSAGALLEREGARPDTLPAPPMGISLDKLDTPANRALLAALENVVQLAEAVDAERGLSVSESERLGPRDTLGIDLAEQVNQIRARVSLEIFGPKGRE